MPSFTIPSLFFAEFDTIASTSRGTPMTECDYFYAKSSIKIDLNRHLFKKKNNDPLNSKYKIDKKKLKVNDIIVK